MCLYPILYGIKINKFVRVNKNKIVKELNSCIYSRISQVKKGWHSVLSSTMTHLPSSTIPIYHQHVPIVYPPTKGLKSKRTCLEEEKNPNLFSTQNVPFFPSVLEVHRCCISTQNHNDDGNMNLHMVVNISHVVGPKTRGRSKRRRGNELKKLSSNSLSHLILLVLCISQ